ETRRSGAGGDDAALRDVQVRLPIDARLRVDQATIGNRERHSRCAPSMLMTAIRTAMPKRTWSRMTACGESATADSISTPRFIGPGFITIASGLASTSFSRVWPY